MVLLLFFIATFCHATHQTVGYSQGNIFYKNKKDVSYHDSAWSVDYRNYFNYYFNGEVSYYNEGHLENNKRDGVILSLGPVLPIMKNIDFSVNIGGYFYANTLITDNNYKDTHGMTPMLEAELEFLL
ncbi:hypothetical protein BGC07_16165 [Piscirickettsia litoralis]|uniref:Uncharacterized protein n=1 Tax=Piscirickettsia litoralis TaxID=1891921 RepID=A0ABX2ZYI3_9GAMM|nr:hypothetical protein BGC07_16165 [Piscirickettsia litoralis]